MLTLNAATESGRASICGEGGKAGPGVTVVSARPTHPALPQEPRNDSLRLIAVVPSMVFGAELSSVCPGALLEIFYSFWPRSIAAIDGNPPFCPPKGLFGTHRSRTRARSCSCSGVAVRSDCSCCCSGPTYIGTRWALTQGLVMAGSRHESDLREGQAGHFASMRGRSSAAMVHLDAYLQGSGAEREGVTVSVAGGKLNPGTAGASACRDARCPSCMARPGGEGGLRSACRAVQALAPVSLFGRSGLATRAFAQDP